MLERIEQEEPAEGRGRAARVEPKAAQRFGLAPESFVRLFDRFDADALASRAVDARAHVFGAVAARGPGLQIEVGGRADLERAESESDALARESLRRGDEGGDAPAPFGREDEESSQLARIFRGGERVTGCEPHATELCVDDRAVNLRRPPEARARRDAHKRVRVVAVERLQAEEFARRVAVGARAARGERGRHAQADVARAVTRASGGEPPQFT